MTRQEWATLASAIRSIWPNTLATRESMEIWYQVLSDLDYKDASSGVSAYIKTEHYPPMPADIRKFSKVTKERPTLGEGEAWELVRIALRNSTYNAEKEYEKLPNDVKRAIGGPATLRSMAMSTSWNEDTERALFVKAYRVEQGRTEMANALSLEDRNKMNMLRLTDGAMKEIEEKQEDNWFE